MKSKIFVIIFHEMGESMEQIGEYIEQILVYGALELFRFQNKLHIGIV